MLHLRSFLLLGGWLLASVLSLSAHLADTARCVLDRQHLSLELGHARGSIVVTDGYQREWQEGRQLNTWMLTLRHHTLSADSCAFAHDYGFPEWALTLAHSDASGVTMRKREAVDMALPVDYTSHMGELWQLYGSFSRPLWQNSRWQVGYALEEGLAFNTRPYRRANNVDNELTGSPLLFYFGASLYAALRLSPQWSLRGDLAFRHVSNGAMARPNKGANWLAPTLALQYRLAPAATAATTLRPPTSHFRRRWYSQWSVSLGARTLLEEWVRTQFFTPPDHEEYRTDRFRTYPTLNVQADWMCRYARRWASGLGIDGFYLPYMQRVRELDGGAASPWKHSAWSLGVAAKHEVYYGPLALYVALGYYLHRQTGSKQSFDETPYYERIGLNYRPARWCGWGIGVGIKAHRTKADQSEITLSYRL